MTGIRFEHPQWIAENCTACGNCYTVCPDTAIPGLVNEIGQVLDTTVSRVKKKGHSLQHLPRAVRKLEQTLRSSLNEAAETDPVGAMLQEAISTTIKDAGLDEAGRKALKQEFEWFNEELDGFQFALSRPYFTLPEKKAAGSGGLLSITVNPYTCKGCMECVQVCDDAALIPVTQTNESVQQLRDQWNFWLDLPNTPQHYIRVDDLEQGVGALETILLDKEAYGALASGDGACLGCSEKTAIHLFTATVESLMQPRVKAHIAHLELLIGKLEQHIQLQLVQEVNVGDTEVLAEILRNSGDHDLTLSDIAHSMEAQRGSQPIDPVWLKRVTGLLGQLKHLLWCYLDGTSGSGRAKMGMLNATGCTSVWGSTYPFNPYPFPWSNHLFQDSASLAMGVFEGHMAKMAEGFKAVRSAELELAGEYRASEHEEFFNYFNWEQFSDEEFHLCPPVVAVGGDGAMYDIGFQNLSRAMMSGKPIKILVVDTQVYSNTGGQACTSGFIGQVSDMAQYGKVQQGKQEVRKEIGLIAMAHRTTYVLQSTIAHANHMIEGFIEGLMARRPALFNLYTSCQPEHGIGDDMGHHQAKLAVESRAYPLYRYNPDHGKTPQECFDLDGNPAVYQDWPSYQLTYLEGGREKTLELPLTFADFAMSEARFRKHFRMAPPDTWHDDMLTLADFMQLAEDEREGKYPYIWTVDKRQHLSRLLVDSTMVKSCEERRDFWVMLKATAGVFPPEADSAADVATRTRQEVIRNIASGLMKLAEGGDVAAGADSAALDSVIASSSEPAAPAAAGEAYMAPWIDTEDCTACDECTNLNGAIFAYNESKKAYIKDALAGPYRDLVKAAEKCTAQVIHPGTPKDPGEKDLDKWIARGARYN
jgi:pyruvate-ferredoxin/flavodoxin oxidoreductase